ncbi:MAG: GGDEF domain-containing protein [Candidatus Sericytochromatia bacterium]|nr:GGDEF domain-containing protein [Candidatus Sericytochromatia bacterium]
MLKPLSEAEDLHSLFERNTIKRPPANAPRRINRLALPEPITGEVSETETPPARLEAPVARGQLLAFPGREAGTPAAPAPAGPSREALEAELAKKLAQAKAELQKQFQTRLQSALQAQEASLQTQKELLALSQPLLQLDEALEARLKGFLLGLGKAFDFWRLRLWVPDFGQPFGQDLRLEALCRSDLRLNLPEAEARLRQVLRSGTPQRLQEKHCTQYFWPLRHGQQTLGVLEAIAAAGETRDSDQQRLLQAQLNLLADYLQAAEQAQAQAAESPRDALTGLLNHRGFFEALDKALHESPNFPLQLICLNLDYLDQINEVHGHRAGDSVLQQLAVLLEGLLPAKGQLGRLQGDSFAALLPQTPGEQALALAEKWRAAVASLKLQGKFEAGLSISISLGLASAPTKGSRALHLLYQQALQALQKAKAKGRNQIQVYTEAPASPRAETARAATASAPAAKTQPTRPEPRSVAASDAAGSRPAPAAKPPTARPAAVKAKPWSEVLKDSLPALETEWLQQAEDYGVPEVSVALEQLKARLPRLMDAFGELLERKTQLESLAQMPVSYFLPSPIVAAIRRGDPRHQLISYEVAFMLLQESLQSVLGARAGAEALIPALDAFFHCINDKLTALKTDLQAGR